MWRKWGLLLARETDICWERVRDSFLCLFFFSLNFPLRCRIYHWRASSSSISLSLPLESMSVIARCATFVATKTSLKQQFAVNNRSSATKIVRYAIKERKRCEHLYIWSFRAFATKVFLQIRTAYFLPQLLLTHVGWNKFVRRMRLLLILLTKFVGFFKFANCLIHLFQYRSVFGPSRVKL